MIETLEKIKILDIYSIIEEIVLLAGKNYLPQREKERLNDMMGAVEFQVSQYYPTLKSILLPRRETKTYNFGTEQVVSFPERWEEPLVQYFLKKYIDLMSQSDKIFCHSNLNEDYVYQNIMNPQIRRKIEKRTMTEVEYDKLTKLLRDAEATQNKIELNSSSHSTESTALAVRQNNSIANLSDTKRLNGLTDALLAVESGFTKRTVKKHKAHGVDAEGIIHERQLMEYEHTSAGLIHRIRESGRVSQEHYQGGCRKCGIAKFHQKCQ